MEGKIQNLQILQRPTSINSPEQTLRMLSPAATSDQVDPKPTSNTYISSLALPQGINGKELLHSYNYLSIAKNRAENATVTRFSNISSILINLLKYIDFI